jgi:hypothetical protein
VTHSPETAPAASAAPKIESSQIEEKKMALSIPDDSFIDKKKVITPTLIPSITEEPGAQVSPSGPVILKKENHEDSQGKTQKLEKVPERPKKISDPASDDD